MIASGRKDGRRTSVNWTRKVCSTSDGVCRVRYGWKGQLYFVHEKAKVNASYYVTELLPNLIKDCRHLLSDNFVFQLRQQLLPKTGSRRNAQISLEKNEWPPNLPDLNPLDYHVWGAMLKRHQKYTLKLINIAELKTALLSIWNDLPKEFIDKAILSFRKRLRSCVAAAGGHFELSV